MSVAYVDLFRSKHLRESPPCNLVEAPGVRHIQAVLLAAAIFVNHVQQGNIGITVLAMTREQNKNPETYYWGHDYVKMSKGSYFYALMATCLYAGYLTTKLDSKLMLFGSTVIGTLVTYLTPTLIKLYSTNAIFFIRLVQGMAKVFGSMEIKGFGARANGFTKMDLVI